MNAVKRFLKNEPVLAISAALAIASAFIVPPDGEYWGYIDFRVLALLLSLMAVVGNAGNVGVLDKLCRRLLSGAGSLRSLMLALVLAPFFASMLITNDVALITFVPLAIAAMGAVARDKLIFVIVMQTVAANLGSAATPIGNPQNLYLSSFYDMPLGEFFGAVLPLTLLSLLLVCITVFFGAKANAVSFDAGEEGAPLNKKKLALCMGLFLLCVLSVLRVIDYRITLAVVLIALFITDRAAICRVDYSLLLTFVFFFIFVGNMARIGAVREYVSAAMEGREMLASALASQCISNVPSALMLSGFTGNGRALLIGTNIGGLGTPIASMASLISLRLYAKSQNAETGKYLLWFSIVNFAYLAAMLGFAYAALI